MICPDREFNSSPLFTLNSCYSFEKEILQIQRIVTNLINKKIILFKSNALVVLEQMNRILPVSVIGRQLMEGASGASFVYVCCVGLGAVHSPSRHSKYSWNPIYASSK